MQDKRNDYGDSRHKARISENLLTTGPNATSLSYDPLMRLYQTVSGGATTRFAYDGLDRIAEYDVANRLLRRYVHGPGDDEPIVWYEGRGTTDRRFLRTNSGDTILNSPFSIPGTQYLIQPLGRRTKLTYPGRLFIDYDYLVTGDMTALRENGATTGVGVLATLAYDDLGRRTSLTRGNGTCRARRAVYSIY